MLNATRGPTNELFTCCGFLTKWSIESFRFLNHLCVLQAALIAVDFAFPAPRCQLQKSDFSMGELAWLARIFCICDFCAARTGHFLRLLVIFSLRLDDGVRWSPLSGDSDGFPALVVQHHRMIDMGQLFLHAKTWNMSVFVATCLWRINLAAPALFTIYPQLWGWLAVTGADVHTSVSQQLREHATYKSFASAREND